MARFNRRRKFCRFSAEGAQEIDYKDLDTLKQYVSETGKIVPAALPAPRPSTSASWPPPSSVPVFWRCCPIRTATSN